MREKSPIWDLLSQIRELDMKNKKMVDNLLQEAKKLFNLEDELDVILLDVLLIQAIIHCVFGSKDEPIEIDEEHAKKRDSYLLALGLLDGYDRATYCKASERHKQYLTNSNYITISYHNPEISDNLDINNSTSLPRQTLSTTDKRCREDLEIFLSNKAMLLKCLEEGKEKFIKENENGERYVDLPKPYYTLENFQPKASEPESDLTDNPLENDDIAQEESEQSTTDGGAGGQVEPYSKGQNGTGSNKLFQTIREKAKALIGFLKIRLKTKDIIVIFILLFMAAGIWEIAQSLRSRNTEATNSTAMTENAALTITGITIHNADITLTPDKPWEKLSVSIYPREANIDDVNYYSDNIHLVTVNRNTERVRLAPEWKKQTEQSTKVHVQFEEIDAETLISVQESQDDSMASPGESSLGGNNSEEVKNTSGF